MDAHQQNKDFTCKKAECIRRAIQEHIKSKGEEFNWALKPYKKKLSDYLNIYGPPVIAVPIIIFFLVSPVLLLFRRKLIFLVPTLILLALLIVILYIEAGKHQVASRLSDKDMRLKAATQNHPVINELTAVGVVKKGFFRRLIFRAVLRIVSLFTGIITIPTVATARWIAADKGRRLVFISNYSNTANSYVRDFIDSRSSAKGINLLFGHGEGFPKTRMLLSGGALDNPEGFMNVFHQNQKITQFWYCPTQNMSVDNIKNNRRIRNGLFKKMNLEAVEKWLQYL